MTSPDRAEDPFLSPQAAAAYTSLQRRYILKLAQDGKLPAHRLSRKVILFRRSDLDAFLAQHRASA